MPKTYVYLRVSTTGQFESGLGEDAQRTAAAQCYEATVKPLGYDPPTAETTFFDGAVSAIANKFLDRPAGALLDRSVKPGDALIFPKLDRGFRNLTDMLVCLERWDEQEDADRERCPVRVFSPDFGGIPYDSCTMQGRWMAVMFGMLAEMEGRRMKERRRASAIEIAKTGRVQGTPPLGFRTLRGYDGSRRCFLHPNDTERFWMRWMAAAAERGWSQREILSYVTKEAKLRTRKGALLSQNTVFKMLEAERILSALEEKAGIRWDSDKFVTPDGVLMRRHIPVDPKWGGEIKFGKTAEVEVDRP